MKLSKQDDLIMDIPANLFQGFEGGGGRLKLTSEVLIFTSHGFNFQNKPLNIKVHDIARVEKQMIPNGLKIVLKNQQEYKFVVAKRQEFFSRLENLL
ncbi:GRAM domain-containing protein [Bacillus swezeyi]|uniref:GRAM domain-containing protein n=1 Tax=Bacillus swezeyi TaxID=1925020 RepID=A0A1R1RF11_9BACI|nr:GRAM domain-containing protein [Bacillus swezeyi]MEC1262010.1 GRAM domain-containing protein [Bacillus swezeyi]MED2930549.1 GRAM domain-containing protein [Bacillus swezeyi]MED2945539.1 GRAM domain-containing protein [Bacillus swezeyi]MED2966590.1 GRAM domain-containing protein [Bacillus swezeyi]MED2979798.1 GRAM domain-containing protein [Bacillus swezeyi]